MPIQRKLFEALYYLTRLPKLDQGLVSECFSEITEETAKTLGIERCSIWFFNDEKNALILSDLYEVTVNHHTKGMVLHEKDFPAYFQYIRQARTLPASNALTDPATKDFKDVYLDPLNIKSLLDAPIIVNEKMIGVLCCEKIGDVKEWTIEDQSFAASVTDLIARGIIASERLKAIEELSHMKENLEEMVARRTNELEMQRRITFNASKMALLGEMATAIAHEINNPLAILDGTVDLLKEMNESEPVSQEALKKRLDQFQKTIWRIEKIVKGLRFFARDSSHDEFSLTKVGDIIDDTLALCQGKFAKNNVKIEVVNPDKELSLECNPVGLSQVLLNLLSNANDALEDKPGRWIRIECEGMNDFVKIRVVDSGTGISPEVRENIMSSFFTTKPAGKGTGLGLSIVRGIIDQHGGNFYLDEKAANTTFVIVIPMKKAVSV